MLPVPPLRAPLRRLIEWTADYYCAPLAAVARMVLASGGALRGPATMTEYRLIGRPARAADPAAARGDRSARGEQATIRELAGIAGVSEGVLRGLVNQGVLEPVQVDCDRPYPPARADFAVPVLNPAQAEVAAEFVAAVEAQAFAPFLLDGVTGSGKTECYFEAVAAALEMGRQVLVLLPEIALTESFLRRFEDRFGAAPVRVALARSSPTERRRAWRAIARGETAQVVVGARSALFLPYANLGLIVVDEAHEVSFKQDDGVRYNARDVAVMRARFEKHPGDPRQRHARARKPADGRERGLRDGSMLPDRFGGARTARRSTRST